MDKSPDAFRTISEVAEDLDVPQHVLRFWESRFPQIKPMKRGGGRRYYRPDDVDLLRGIRHLLYGEGYTIRGVQRILREQGGRFVQSVWREGAPKPQLQPHEEQGDTNEGSQEPAGAQGDGRRSAARAKSASESAAPESPVPDAVMPAATPPVAPALSVADLQRLRSSLDIMVECRRRIDQVLAG
jgi:DNA-binding transcriptional MerR regulator